MHPHYYVCVLMATSGSERGSLNAFSIGQKCIYGSLNVNEGQRKSLVPSGAVTPRRERKGEVHYPVKGIVNKPRG